MTIAPMTLYTFWRSQAAYRVRIALHLKGISVESRTIDLLKGEQHAPSYRDINPEGLVPALIADGASPLVQSLAILEYLDEVHPQPPLLPKDPRDRAHVRALAYVPAMDAHPLIIPRVRSYLEKELGLDESARGNWLRHWMESANRAIEELLSRDTRTGRFSFGDNVTMADICLVAHFTSATMLYDCRLGDFPTAERIFKACMELDAFARTHPREQPGASSGH